MVSGSCPAPNKRHVTFADLMKALGIPLEDSADPFGSMFAAVDTIIENGIAPKPIGNFYTSSSIKWMIDKIKTRHARDVTDITSKEITWRSFLRPKHGVGAAHLVRR